MRRAEGKVGPFNDGRVVVNGRGEDGVWIADDGTVAEETE